MVLLVIQSPPSNLDIGSNTMDFGEALIHYQGIESLRDSIP